MFEKDPKFACIDVSCQANSLVLREKVTQHPLQHRALAPWTLEAEWPRSGTKLKLPTHGCVYRFRIFF